MLRGEIFGDFHINMYPINGAHFKLLKISVSHLYVKYEKVLVFVEAAKATMKFTLLVAAKITQLGNFSPIKITKA